MQVKIFALFLSMFIYLLIISIQLPSGILFAESFTLDIWSFHSLGMHDFNCRHSIMLVIYLYLDVSSIWCKKLPLSSKISFIYKIALSMNCLLNRYTLFIFKFSFNNNDWFSICIRFLGVFLKKTLIFPIYFKLKLKYFPYTMLTWWSTLIWQDTSHHKVAILLFHGGDLVRLITFEGTILYQAVSCFSGKKLPLVFQSDMYLYFKNLRDK